jgi:uncharacterized membrane protein
MMNRPDRTDVAALASVFCTGQLAGMMLAIAVAQVATADLPKESWTLRQQADDALFRRVMPLVFALNIMTLGAAFARAKKKQRPYFGAAGLFFVGTVADTMLVDVPINVKISKWTAGDAPENWRIERDKWLQGHWLRTAFGTLSFALCAIAMQS